MVGWKTTFQGVSPIKGVNGNCLIQMSGRQLSCRTSKWVFRVRQFVFSLKTNNWGWQQYLGQIVTLKWGYIGMGRKNSDSHAKWCIIRELDPRFWKMKRATTPNICHGHCSCVDSQFIPYHQKPLYDNLRYPSNIKQQVVKILVLLEHVN